MNQKAAGRIRIALCAVLLSITAARAHGGSALYKTIYAFNANGDLSDGGTPESTVVVDRAGNVYGTTFFGGSGSGCDRNYLGCGLVFKIESDGSETILHRFSGVGDGGNPTSSLILDAQGNLYGTTPYGGRYGFGIVFRIGANGEESVLHHFRGGPDGANPASGLVLDSSGNLYGTTQYGGRGCYGQGCGTVFRIGPDGAERILYRFRDGEDGASPRGTVGVDENGDVYGVAWLGGQFGFGTVFVIEHVERPNRGESDDDESLKRRFRVLHAFTDGDDGANPIGGIVLDKSGSLFGATSAGGSFTQGTIFKLNAQRQFSVLHAFTGGSDGASPYGNIVLDADGNLYGTAATGGSSTSAGTVFEIPNAGSFKTLYEFVGDSTDGGNPMAGVVLGPNGNLYGTLMQAGANGWGSVFEVERNGKPGTADRGLPYRTARSPESPISNDAQLEPLCHARISAPITVATPKQRFEAGSTILISQRPPICGKIAVISTKGRVYARNFAGISSPSAPGN